MRELIEKIIKANLSIVIDRAKVLSVTETHCKAESLTNGSIYFKCALNAIQKNQDDELKATPVVNSEIVVGVLPDGSAFVISMSRVEKLHYRQGKTEMTIDGNGFKITRDNENLFDGIKDLAAEVKKIVVIYGNGPDVAAIDLVMERINKILI
ncbi:hypothetical protein [Flavobacterium cerinum]|uniref:Uncharacterized protein n=1 Tax=Flavobacterium cerinum TaxID=2502784 RepID=A0A3S3QTS7_9FLAO|nr:hypothetical protein [Flavobacterium cerinum]RWX03359.1 hypothetical protein EPI11_00070 [Flavobacterium cerinum]